MTYTTLIERREPVLNLADWIERRKSNLTPYADHIIHSVKHYEDYIEAQQKRIDALEATLDGVMVGGNHLALILGADHPPYDADHDTALSKCGAGIQYDVWCCWSAIMKARQALQPSTTEEKT